MQNEDQKTPLDLALISGELETARLLIKSGSNVNSQSSLGWTPLHTAARNGHLILVKLLLDSGADTDIRTRNTTSNGEETAFDLAWKNGKRDVASFLARQSGNVRALDIVSSAPSGAESQDSPTDEIVNGGDSNLSDNSLHNALSSDSHIDAFQRLLNRGADVNERDERLKTPLHVASYDGKLEIAKILIKYGADVNSRDNEGWTPLHWAAPNHGLVDILRLLLDNGADIDATEREGDTALHIASGNGKLETVRFLLGREANPHIRNVYGRTASQNALLGGHRKIAQLLSEYDVGGV